MEEATSSSNSVGGAAVPQGATLLKNVALAGLMAGALEHVTMYPLDLIKTRMQLHSPHSPKMYTPYTGILNGTWTILREEGPFRLYRGFFPASMGFLPHFGLRYAANELLKNTLFFDGVASERRAVRYGTIGVAGALAGGIESLVIAPVDAFTIRLQHRRAFHKKFMNSLSDVDRQWLVKYLAERKGVYNRVLRDSIGKAASATLLRQVTYGASLFMSYEYLKMQWTNEGETLKGFPKLLCGVLAGTCAAILGSPFDVVKSRIQSGEAEYRSLRQSFSRILSEEGFLTLFRGLSVKMFRIAVGTGICLVAFEEILRVMIEPPML